MGGIFKAYDVRGVYGDGLDEEVAGKIGLAFRHVLDEADRDGGRIVVSRDMRGHSEPLMEALVEGLLASGLDVVDIGLATTPMNYFAVGHLAAAGGVQVTASHNPGRYNGFKFSLREARPVSGDHGIPRIEEAVRDGDLPRGGAAGRREEADVFEPYAEHVLAHLAGGGMPFPLKVAVDAANGMGTIYRPILERMGIELVPLYFELDGTFPNHEANPLKLENLRDLSARVRESDAALGIAFDGDADRAAFVDERGEPVGSDLMTGLVAGALLDRGGPSTIVYDLRSSRAVAEYVREHGGTPLRERVGHSFIKATLRAHEGVFGGELAGHYYFRDNFFADCSLMAVIEVLNLLRATGKPLSELVRPLERYAKSPEINFEVEDKAGKMEEIVGRFSDGELDRLDGITVQYPDWWFNVRPSNTEPYLRLVMEADTPERLAERQAELVALLGEPV
ncbi:MAG: phosphomannomutase/phosphoglucomutase [Thermoanaerobaculia bacterium]